MQRLKQSFSINRFYKSFNKRVFIIAEIGINHEGSVDKCIEMINKAKDSGADAIKIQTMDPNENYCKNSKSYEIFSKSKLTDQQTFQIFDYCKKKDIKIFTTVGDKRSLNFIKKLKPFAFKISSGLLNHVVLLNEILRMNKPTVISTGMANKNDLNILKESLKKFNNKKVCILHCISLYPTPQKLLCFDYIQNLKDDFNLPIGYSDHTTDPLIPSYAVLSGAVMIEKHFTFDEKRLGYDHHISFNSKKFCKMVSEIRRIEEIMFSDNLNQEKKKIRLEFSRCIVAKKKIEKNEILSEKNLSIKRPNSPENRGADPIHLNYVMGKKINKNMDKDSPIKLKDVF